LAGIEELLSGIDELFDLCLEFFFRQSLLLKQQCIGILLPHFSKLSIHGGSRHQLQGRGPSLSAGHHRAESLVLENLPLKLGMIHVAAPPALVEACDFSRWEKEGAARAHPSGGPATGREEMRRRLPVPVLLNVLEQSADSQDAGELRRCSAEAVETLTGDDQVLFAVARLCLVDPFTSAS
jgi:hypothetical protein